jgi:hypothetical protein
MNCLEVTILVGKVFPELSKMPANESTTLKFLERCYEFEGCLRTMGILAQSRALRNHPPSQLQGM